MAWGRNQAGCACCGSPCRALRYPIGKRGVLNTDLTRIAESNFYYALNTPKGEDSFNPVTGLTYQQDLSDIGVLILGHLSICSWEPVHFGNSEFVKFLDRGKTIVITGEWRDCFRGVYSPGYPSGFSVTNALMSAFGVRGMSWMNPDVFRYGCQTMTNRAEKNNLNKNVNFWGLGGSNLITVNPDYAWSLVQDNHPDNPNENTVVAAEIVNEANGKVVLMADENMFDCFSNSHLGLLLANLCKFNGKPIEPIN